MTRATTTELRALALRALADKHLYLAGYRGSGKTSVGRLLGQHLSRRWIDCDDQIESDAGRSIREIFAGQGEATFRDLEEAAIARIAGESPAIVSLGGGAVLRPANRQRISSSGMCVWLQLDAETASQRLAGDSTTSDRRPALTDLPHREEIEKLLAQRRPWYEQVADYRVDTRGQSVAQIVQRVLEQLAAAPRVSDPASGPST